MSLVKSWTKTRPHSHVVLACDRETLAQYFDVPSRLQDAEEALKDEQFQVWWPKCRPAEMPPGIGLVRVSVPSKYGKTNKHDVFIMYSRDGIEDVVCKKLASSSACTHMYATDTTCALVMGCPNCSNQAHKAMQTCCYSVMRAILRVSRSRTAT